MTSGDGAVRRNVLSRREFLYGVAGGSALAGALSASVANGASHLTSPADPVAVPDKLVVLTFDDAVKSHWTFVAPFLKGLGFRATFFVSHRWMNDYENFMTWQEIAKIHQMGFEIGNHTWTHDNFSSPRNVARLEGELALIERELNKVGVPRPVSFAYPGDDFGPEAVRILRRQGYRFARRGMQPEVPYGQMQIGPAFDPKQHHPLLIPTTADAYPDWTLEYFQQVVARAQDAKIVVLQFHGVPDLAHPWVYTPPENFRQYMTYLKENGFQAIALRDLEPYVNLENPPDDPALKVSYPAVKYDCQDLPEEVLATRSDLQYWLENMLRFHHYTLAEAAEVCGLTETEVEHKAADLGLYPARPETGEGKQIRILPYPGGRHPRIGFKEGAINPMRGTKASVFLPWDPTSYVVVDLPEAIFCNLGLLFLAHTDIPTIWDEQNIVLENLDWERGANGVLTFSRFLPSGIVFGASIEPSEQYVQMELWIRNFGGQDLTGFQTEPSPRGQVCVMLKGAPGFNAQTNDNKIFRDSVAAARADSGHDRWILTAWERAGRVWGNPQVPCIHCDPLLPDCAFGKTVRTRGRLWFYEGKQIEQEIERARKWFSDSTARIVSTLHR
jgi:peptidoglycan/xylan/chitin deacetylase (PgdA/CDA1 family)